MGESERKVAGKYSAEFHPFIDNDSDESEASKTSILITCNGFKKRYENLAGRSIASVRESMEDFLNITKSYKNKVNSENALPTYILQEGDHLEFYRNASSKG